MNKIIVKYGCFCCNTTIDKKGNFIMLKCDDDDDDCGNFDYFCSELCIEKMSKRIDFSKCNCCEGKITKIIKYKNIKIKNI